MFACAFAGAALIVVASFARGVKDKYQDFCFAALLPVMLLLLSPLELLTAWLRPVTLDATLRAIDVATKLDGFALTRFLSREHLYFLVPAFYDVLPLSIAAAWAFERPRFLMRDVVAGALLAFPFYLAVPACGPQYAFPAWPWSDAGAISAIPRLPRNCFPSMHFAWALLVALDAKNRIWKAAFYGFAGVTAVVAVAGGEHYVIDILAAIPFVFGVRWITRKRAGVRGGDRAGDASPC